MPWDTMGMRRFRLCKSCGTQISRLQDRHVCYECYFREVSTCTVGSKDGHYCNRCGTTQPGYCKCQKGTSSD